nr:uncharacterized protein LOC106678067 [Halyomorpha halys]
MPKRPASTHCTCGQISCCNNEHCHHKRIRIKSNDRRPKKTEHRRHQRNPSPTREMKCPNIKIKRQKRKLNKLNHSSGRESFNEHDDIYNPPRKRAKEAKKSFFSAILQTETDLERLKGKCFEEDSFMVRWVKI